MIRFIGFIVLVPSLVFCNSNSDLDISNELSQVFMKKSEEAKLHIHNYKLFKRNAEYDEIYWYLKGSSEAYDDCFYTLRSFYPNDESNTNFQCDMVDLEILGR